MIKNLLHFIVFLCAPLLALSQSGIDIRYDSDGAAGPNPPSGSNLSGSVYTINLYPSSPELVGGLCEVHFIVTNNTGSDEQWQIVRKKINVPSTWVDQICWPPLCYNTNGAIYTTPNSGGYPAPTVLNGTSITSDGKDAELKPRITPDQSIAGNALYRYYIHDVATGVNLDSVDLSIGFVLGFNSVKPSTIFAVSPNPADNFTNITLGSNDNTTVKIVDALGKVIRIENVSNGYKSLDVSELKTGVYFVFVESSGNKPLTRKLIIKH